MSKSLFDLVLKEVDARIQAALKRWRTPLSQTTGALPVNQVPSGIPGSRLGPGTVTPTELSFDPATQAELDAHAAVVASTSTSGHVKIDGTSITISGGVISSTGGSPLTIEEVDGSPTVSATTLKFPNGTLGVVGTVATYTPPGGGGSIDVTDGTTTVSPTSVLRLPAGTVTDNGSGEAEYVPAGGGLIAEQVLVSDATTVTFSSIPGTYRHLRLIAAGRITQATTEDYVYIRFNGDSGSNYDEIRSNNGSFGQSSAQTKARIGDFPGTSAPSGSAGQFELLIPAYALTTFHKTVRSNSGVWDQSSTGVMNEFFARWRDTSAIATIELSLGSGDFLAGSIFSLYGMG